MLFNHARALQKMDEAGLDALVAGLPRNVYYASGFWHRNLEWGSQEAQATVVIPRDPAKPAVLVLPEFAIANLLESPTWITKIRVTEFLNTSMLAREPEPVRLDPLQADVEKLYGERVVGGLDTDIIAGTASALKDLGLTNARVGFDDLRLALHLQRELTGLQWRDAHDTWLDIRKVKTEAELAHLRTGARINEQGLHKIMPMIRPGRPWHEVTTAFRNHVQAEGGSLLASQKSLQFGAEYGGEYFPDLMFADNSWKVRDKQTIIFECWGQYANYHFDMSRTVHVGEPTAEYRRICAAIDAGQREAVPLFKPGMSTHEAWQAISKIAYGLDVPTPKKMLVFMHSIGLDIIELPSQYPAFGRLKPWTLEEGTVINFEFLYFGHSVSPYHLESSYRIGANGAEPLHTMANQLFVLE